MKKIYSLAGSVLLSGFVFGQISQQHAIYSFANGEKYTPGAITQIPMRTDLNSQDRTTYYTQNFDAGFGAWGASIQSGTAPFKLTNTGHDNTTGNTFIIPTLMSSTPTQWVVLDSDADGTSYSNAEASKLTSNKIDLSATTGQFVALEFEQFFAEWDINTYTNAGSEDHCYIAISLDSSVWTEIEINEGVGREGRPNPEMISWDITDIIAPDNSEVWIRFRWEGAWNYGWQLDNVKIIDINEKDLTIMDTYRGYNNAGLQYSMVPQIQATEFQIGAIVRNTGHIDQTNIGIDFEIKDPSNTVVASGSASSTVTLANSEQDTFWVATGYTPDVLGNYTITWTATSVEGDDDLSDNTVIDDYFELTEYTYAQDFAEGAAEGITNWPLETGEGRFGNLFNFQIADEVSAIHVKIANNSSNVGQPIFWEVYYNDGTAWTYMDQSADDYEIQTADLGQIITLPLPDGIDVNETDLYLFMVGHYGSPTDAIFERQGDIGWSYIQGAVAGPDELSSFFDRKAPIVRLRVGAGDVSVGEETITEYFAVYPNPAVDAVNVSLSLNASENTVINVLDLTGKVVKTIGLGEVNGSKTVAVSLDEMNSGVYFIELVNQNGRQVEKFVKK
ncbi:MAG: T9SS type A sorting domain-containing protein [Crocinitomicaceae bacterium]|nr:T9SS type A sorting domain-containing protein [Crocinitomicaceae bacterium]